MNIKRDLVSLAVFTLLLNPLMVFFPIKTEAALPAVQNFNFALLAAGQRTAVLAETSNSTTNNNNGSE